MSTLNFVQTLNLVLKGKILEEWKNMAYIGGVYPFCNSILALHDLDFVLYFSLENSILSCVTVGPITYLQHLKKKKKKKKKTCHFHIWYPFNYIFTSKFQIKHWNMLYNVHTCIAIFFHISYNPVSTHSINQNSYYKLCFTKIHKL